MKTTVEISDPLFREAKEEAQRTGTTLRDLIEIGLRRVLEERKATKRPFKFRDASNPDAKPLPGIDPSDWPRIRDIIYGFDDLEGKK
ncbi:MAG TPA: hypothetical protein VL326_23465 [Kofleriaceae bacterium]|jgi:hypothetical protein|nr:hypothetical protein [Kofleriaceae bacterium]